MTERERVLIELARDLIQETWTPIETEEQKLEIAADYLTRVLNGEVETE